MLAEIVRIASGGVVDFLFTGLMPGLSSVDIIAYSLEGTEPPYTHLNAIVAEFDSEPAGMVLSYSSSLHGITEEMRQFFPPERLSYLSHFYEAKVENSWYIDAIGVFEEYRRRGIGALLMKSAAERARENGFSALSLIAFADNTPALELYQSYGFYLVRAVPLERTEQIPHEGGGLLLRCDLE
jgi:ribosomal protein S18 acetylase RimI-like enzyme